MGPLKILGCRCTVAGCQQKDFPVYVQDWHPHSDLEAEGLLENKRR